MSVKAILTGAVAAFALAGALTACSPVEQAAAPDATPAATTAPARVTLAPTQGWWLAEPIPDRPTAYPQPWPGGTDYPGCELVAWYSDAEENLIGSAADIGVIDYASGQTETDDSGTVVAYTVAPGDTLFAIQNRVCVTSSSIASLNGIRYPDEIQAGQRLILASP